MLGLDERREDEKREKKRESIQMQIKFERNETWVGLIMFHLGGF